MINTIKPATAPGHDDKRSEILEKISKEYGKPEEKQREAVKKLGKDEFFKIMVTQIQHQDPLKPYQNEQMAAQMAQFTALEQMMNVNKNLESLTGAQAPLQQLGAANLIGKHVTVDSAHVMHTEGKKTDLKFQLPDDAAKVHVVILNDKGENIRELDASNLKRGDGKIEWDGKRSNNFAAPTGAYRLQVTAENENGRQMNVKTAKTEIVHGIGFEGKDTVLLTGDVRSPHRTFLRDVSKIVDSSSSQGPGAPGVGESSIPALGQSGIQETGQSGEQAGAQPIEEDSGERPMEDYKPGITSKYTAVNMANFMANQQKPGPQAQKLSDEEIRKVLANGPDLTEANPVAQAMKSGKPIPETPAAGQSGNQAVRQSGQQDAVNSAPAQSLPSSEEGSTAGKWGE